MSVVQLTMAPFLRCAILCCLCVLSLGCSCEVVSTSESDRLGRLVSEMTCNDCVDEDAKFYSLTHSLKENTYTI